MWNNICRLCSSRGDYEVFSIIPTYLHASPNEFLLWQKPINKLLEETTGLTIDENDGLPQKMCALCISYLKHAATFRQQAINNAMSLKAISILNSRKKMPILNQAAKTRDTQTVEEKESVLITANDRIYSEERKPDANRLVNILNNQNSKVIKTDESMKKFLLLNGNKGNTSRRQPDGITTIDENEDVLAMTYLNLLFDKDTNSSARKLKRLSHNQTLHRRPPGDNNLVAIFDEMNNTTSDPLGEEFQTASSDENEAIEQKNNFFSYREKNFEEDDIMDLDELKESNITINIPETCKERKCRACFRRFMFEESYKEHMNVCIEYKFLLFIEEINRLLDIRRSKAVSPHEFIRRMIFCLRKTCQWLKSSCGQILLPDLLINGDAKKRLASDGKNSTAEISSGANSDEATEKFAEEGNKTVIERKNSLLDILKQDTTSLNPKNVTKEPYLEVFKTHNKFSKSTPERSTKILTNLLEKSPNESDSLIKPVKFENILALIDGQESIKETSKCTLLLQDKEKSKDKSNVTILDERSNFFEKLKKASMPTHKVGAVSSKKSATHTSNILFPSNLNDIKFSARCNNCNTVFDSVASLEQHNANFHNSHAPKIHGEHEKIISLFEDDNTAENITTKKNI